MWDNLLSGTIGSVIGLVGAVAAALLTVRWARRDQAAHAEVQRQIDKSGNLANHLVALYEELRLAVARDTEPTVGDTDRLRLLASDFRRSVVVDAPLLPVALEENLKASRKLITELLDRRDPAVTKAELATAKQSVKDAGDNLRDFRRPRTDAARANG